jgi:hypothetical protein
MPSLPVFEREVVRFVLDTELKVSFQPFIGLRIDKSFRLKERHLIRLDESSEIKDRD